MLLNVFTYNQFKIKCFHKEYLYYYLKKIKNICSTDKKCITSYKYKYCKEIHDYVNNKITIIFQ